MVVLGGGAATRRRYPTAGLSLPIMCAASVMILPVLSADPPDVSCAGRVGAFGRSGGVHRPAPILPVQAKAPPRRTNPVIIFGTYLAQAAANAQSPPCATACDTMSPDRLRACQGRFQVVVAGAGFELT